MSTKIFKALSTLVIFSMFVMAVGTVGVQPAKAALNVANGFNDSRVAAIASPAALPFFDDDISLFADAGAVGDVAVCGSIPVGAKQMWLFSNAAAGMDGETARAHVFTGTAGANLDVVVGIFQASAAGVMEAVLNCATNSGSTSREIDVVAAVPEGKRILVLVGGVGVVPPTNVDYHAWVTMGDDPSGGVIIAGLSNPAAGAVANDDFILYDTVDEAGYFVGDAEVAGFDDIEGAGIQKRNFFVDVDATHTYNLGLFRESTALATDGQAILSTNIGPYFYSRVAATGLHQDWIAEATATLRFSGQALNATGTAGADFVAGSSTTVCPAGGELGFCNMDTGLVDSFAGALTEDVDVSPGAWDVGIYDDNAGVTFANNAADYFLAVAGQSLGVAQILPVNLRAYVSGAALVRLGVPSVVSTWADADIFPSVGFLQVGLDFDGADTWLPANGYNPDLAAEMTGEHVILSPGVEYDLTGNVDIDKGGNDFFLTPITNPWIFTATDFSVAVPVPAYDPIFGMWQDRNANWAKGATEHNFRISSFAWSGSDVARGAWVDGMGHELVAIRYPDNTRENCLTGLAVTDAGGGRDAIFPCYVVVNGVTGVTLLDNTFGITALTPTMSGIGRWQVQTWLQMLPAGGNVTTGAAQLLYTSSPADATIDHWAWNYIMGAYEMGITTGTGAGFEPEMVVTRAQMAVFVLRAEHGGTYTPPAVGTSTGFADVPTTHWAAAWIKQFAAEGITTGCTAGNYCPDNNVTRGEMSLFLEKMARWIVMNGGNAYFAQDGAGTFANGNAALGTPGGIVNTAGYDGLFIDVPISHWAAIWIEELAADGITAGCGGALAEGTWKYCPEQSVTRGEMTAFLARAFYEANPGFVGYVFPSPPR